MRVKPIPFEQRGDAYYVGGHDHYGRYRIEYLAGSWVASVYGYPIMNEAQNITGQGAIFESLEAAIYGCNLHQYRMISMWVDDGVLEPMAETFPVPERSATPPSHAHTRGPQASLMPDPYLPAIAADKTPPAAPQETAKTPEYIAEMDSLFGHDMVGGPIPTSPVRHEPTPPLQPAPLPEIDGTPAQPSDANDPECLEPAQNPAPPIPLALSDDDAW